MKKLFAEFLFGLSFAGLLCTAALADVAAPIIGPGSWSGNPWWLSPLLGVLLVAIIVIVVVLIIHKRRR